MKKLLLRLLGIVAVAGACALTVRPAAAQVTSCPDVCGLVDDFDGQCAALNCPANGFCASGCEVSGGYWVMSNGSWEYYNSACRPTIFCYY